MRRLADLSIRRKLIALSMLASGAALLAATVSFVLYERDALRHSLVRTLESEAAIVGANAVAALVFGDQDAAVETLAALGAEREIRAAAVFDKAGSRFATYTRPGVLPADLPARLEDRGPRQLFESGRVTLVRSIAHEGKPIGSVMIQSDLSLLRRSGWDYVGIATLVLLASVLLALVVASRLQRMISGPILELAETARSVSRDKDYSVRALPRGRDEVGRLVGTFNAMLEQISLRDAELQRAQAEAEAGERRAELLADVSSELASSLETESALPRVARRLVPGAADWASLHLVEGQRVRQVAAAAADPAIEALARSIEERYPSLIWQPFGVARAIRDNRTWLVPELTAQALEELAADADHAELLSRLTGAMLLVPLASRGNSFGVLCLGLCSPGRAFARSDVSLAEGVAGRIAHAIDNARLYREAQEANRMKDQFLATLSHELRTPLNAIVGWVQLLRAGKLDADTSRRALETIDRNARVQAQLIEDLLDVSSIISGKLELRLQPVDPLDVVEAALDAVAPAAAAKEIVIAPALERDGPRQVVADPDRLQQVVWNLLSNAIKFTPRGGSVRVRVASAEGRVRIEVDDSGVGIPAEFLGQIFERFTQADASSTRAHRGLGLGLAIVRHLVERHGGTVRAASAGPDRGSTFTVELPLRPAPGGRESRAAAGGGALEDTLERGSAPDALAGLSVLLVDDHADALELLSTLLRAHGARVVAADSAEGALRALQLELPDVLVSDIEMPRMDGYTLIRHIRALSPERGGRIPAAALTAYARPEDRAQALEAGFQLHIPKPVRPAELVDLIARLGGVRSRNVEM